MEEIKAKEWKKEYLHTCKCDMNGDEWEEKDRTGKICEKCGEKLRVYATGEPWFLQDSF